MRNRSRTRKEQFVTRLPQCIMINYRLSGNKRQLCRGRAFAVCRTKRTQAKTTQCTTFIVALLCTATFALHTLPLEPKQPFNTSKAPVKKAKLIIDNVDSAVRVQNCNISHSYALFYNESTSVYTTVTPGQMFSSEQKCGFTFKVNSNTKCEQDFLSSIRRQSSLNKVLPSGGYRSERWHLAATFKGQGGSNWEYKYALAAYLDHRTSFRCGPSVLPCFKFIAFIPMCSNFTLDIPFTPSVGNIGTMSIGVQALQLCDCNTPHQWTAVRSVIRNRRI